MYVYFVNAKQISRNVLHNHHNYFKNSRVKYLKRGRRIRGRVATALLIHTISQYF